uniref:Uncharacterized protein n=1 Tax=Anguilla anguilla TaxID=7936 RepID=A0A0E9XC46_ANGAN
MLRDSSSALSNCIVFLPVLGISGNSLGPTNSL